MAKFEEYSELPDDFSGVVRLFPLPNLVMFPGVMQPLHIFEPRYCEMLLDALAGDRLIAMALLQPGWESDYEGRPAIAPVVCIGRVASHAATKNGRHNILLLGARRASVIRELPPERPFRLAQVELLEDLYSPGGTVKRSKIHQELITAFRQFIPHSAEAKKQFDEILSGDIPLGFLADLVAFTSHLEPPDKQELLAQCNVDERATQLLRQLQDLTDKGTFEHDGNVRNFPPEFSDN